MSHPKAKVHRMFELLEPIATVTYSEVANEAFMALGMRNFWDGYFAGRAAPLGLAPAEVVHAKSVLHAPAAPPATVCGSQIGLHLREMQRSSAMQLS